MNHFKILGNWKILDILIRYGANNNTRTDDGFTVLEIAERGGKSPKPQMNALE